MQMELLHCLDISTIGLHQGMIRAIDTNLDYMYLLPEVLRESHSAEPKESKSDSNLGSVLTFDTTLHSFFGQGFVIFPFLIIATPIVEANAALGSASELVVLVF